MLNILSRPVVRQYIVVISVNLCVICVGMGFGWPSPMLVKLRNETETVLEQPMTEEQGAWIVSIGYLVGAFANLFLPAVLVDNVGRKYSILLGCLPRLTAGFLFIFATTAWMVMLGRALMGISDGCLLIIVPMYASEIASKEVRGALGSILQIFASVGMLLMLSIGPFVSFVAANIIFTVTVFVTAIPILFLPDSPYFLYSKGRTEGSIKVLTFLRGSEAAANEETKEYDLMINSGDKKINKLELFRNKIFVKSFVIVIIFGAGGQLIGSNAVQFYLQTILESTNTSLRDEIGSVIIGCIQLIACFFTAALVDKFGRKPIMISAMIGMTIGMFGLGTFFFIAEGGHPITNFMNYLPLISLVLYIFCFSAGYSSVMWMIVPELFEGPARSIGVSASVSISTFASFLTTRFFPSLTTSIGSAATYWMFGGTSALFCLFILFCIPETKGKTFAEIQVALGARERRRSNVDNSIVIKC